MGRRTSDEPRRRRVPSGGTPSAPIVRDFSRRPSGTRVEFDARTGYDFLITLLIDVGDESEIPAEDVAWLREARASLPAGIRSSVEEWVRGERRELYDAFGMLIVRDSSIADAAALVRAVAGIDAVAMAQLLAEDLAEGPVDPGLVERAISGDREARGLIEDRIDQKHRAEMSTFLADPDGHLARAADAMAAWLPAFQRIEDRVRRIIERDVADRAADLATLDAGQLIERTTGGIRWMPEGATRVILAPTYFARPYNLIFSGRDWRLFCYPVADTALAVDDGVTPPSGVVRLYRALGDATRLRVLRLLADRDWYLTELAQQLELSKPTMKHHLAQLRAAGLVTVTEEGALTYYSLRRERIEEAGLQLRDYLD